MKTVLHILFLLLCPLVGHGAEAEPTQGPGPRTGRLIPPGPIGPPEKAQSEITNLRAAVSRYGVFINRLKSGFDQARNRNKAIEEAEDQWKRLEERLAALEEAKASVSERRAAALVRPAATGSGRAFYRPAALAGISFGAGSEEDEEEEEEEENGKKGCFGRGAERSLPVIGSAFRRRRPRPGAPLPSAEAAALEGRPGTPPPHRRIVKAPPPAAARAGTPTPAARAGAVLRTESRPTATGAGGGDVISESVHFPPIRGGAF